MSTREPTDIDRDELIEETRHVIHEIEEAVEEALEEAADQTVTDDGRG